MAKNITTSLKRAYSGRIAGFIIGTLLALISIACFVQSNRQAQLNIDRQHPFLDVYKKGNIDNSGYYFVNVKEEPYAIGYYNDSEYFFYVTDDTNLYILKCPYSVYEKIHEDINEKGRSHIVGTVTTLKDEVIDLAISVYNGDDTDPEGDLTREDFSSYFCDVGIEANGMASSESTFVFGGICLAVISVIILISASIPYVRHRLLLKEMSESDTNTLCTETGDPRTVYIKKGSTYLTPGYLISFGSSLNVIKYQDILWAYRVNERSGLGISLTAVKLLTADMRYIQVSEIHGIVSGRDEMINQVLDAIHTHNPQTAIGYTPDYINYFTMLHTQATESASKDLFA
ncbi:MAG: hypothetical protein J5802_14560 [Butyrivibrio sp.]|nr:hypothetical protein [Butyrivibrio sp.]